MPRLVGKDINEMWKLDNPMGLLTALLQSRGLASPESRYNKYTLVLEFKRCRQSHETNIFSLKKTNECSAADFGIFLKKPERSQPTGICFNICFLYNEDVMIFHKIWNVFQYFQTLLILWYLFSPDSYGKLAALPSCHCIMLVSTVTRNSLENVSCC